MADERSKRAANNKSLRIIKNELEALNERGFITDDKYDQIVATLPAEASLNGAATAPAPSASPLSAAFGNMSVNDTARASPNPPPSYSQTPAAPPRSTGPKEVGHAVALYRYNDPSPNDLNLEAGDHISVTEFVNADWWMGKNVRTGEEGIFPKSYVRQEYNPSPASQPGATPAGGFYNNEKQGYNPGPVPYQPPQQQGYYPAQQQSNPYNSHVPPMAVAEQPVETGKPSKGEEMGKKFGKKLGNAAIFGAGATIGGKIVNGIF